MLENIWVNFLIILYFQILIHVEILTAHTKASVTLILPGSMLASAKMIAHHTRNRSVLQMVELSRTCVSSRKKFAKHVEITRTITLEAAEVMSITKITCSSVSWSHPKYTMFFPTYFFTCFLCWYRFSSHVKVPPLHTKQLISVWIRSFFHNDLKTKQNLLCAMQFCAKMTLRARL